MEGGADTDNQPASVKAPDPNGRVTSYSTSAPPTYDEIWQAHMRRNWDRRTTEERPPRPQKNLRRVT
jgi:hypothetical protein